VLLPYALIVGGHYSATAAGAALIPMPLVMAVSSPRMGSLAGRTGSRLPLIIGPMITAMGFVMLWWCGSDASYWVAVFPAIVLISVGMSAAAAPLTTAVLKSVDSAHTGSASGFNSAISRTGGLVATALLGAVLAATGPAMIAHLHIALVVGAAAAIASSVSALLWVRN
jgi:predicted MFS family arabinose efflux permease